MVGHMFQNYDTVYARFFPTYSCNHSCYTIYVRFLSRILAFFPALWVQTRIYMRTKKSIYMRYKQACGIWGHMQSFLLHDIRAFFCHVYLRSFLLCGYKRAYTCAQKSTYICVTNKHVVYGVTESGRIRVTELYRPQKNPSCTMELKGNFGLNKSWLQWPS